MPVSFPRKRESSDRRRKWIPDRRKRGVRNDGLRRLTYAATCIALYLSLLAAPAFAVAPGEMLDDPAQEARARALSAEIRCLVCQNQSIDDSDASLAKDMRLLVREQIKDGKTDQQIRDFLVARYGDFVLLNPPVKRSTWLLWFGPLLVLIAGVAGLTLYFRSRAKQAAPAMDGLSADEQAQLDKLLRDEDRAP